MQERFTDLKPKIFTYVMAILFVCTTLTIAAQKKAGAPAVASVFAPDKGKFTIQLNGKSVGQEESGWWWLAGSKHDRHYSARLCGGPRLRFADVAT
jgi:hypothetical protein